MVNVLDSFANVPRQKKCCYGRWWEKKLNNEDNLLLILSEI